MSDTVKPALTAEQWARQFKNADPFHIRADGTMSFGGLLMTDGHRHRLAALCLYQQSFGFSQEDVDALAAATRAADILLCRGEGTEAMLRTFPRLAHLSARIAALLPPSDSEGPS